MHNLGLGTLINCPLYLSSHSLPRLSSTKQMHEIDAIKTGLSNWPQTILFLAAPFVVVGRRKNVCNGGNGAVKLFLPRGPSILFALTRNTILLMQSKQRCPHFLCASLLFSHDPKNLVSFYTRCCVRGALKLKGGFTDRVQEVFQRELKRNRHITNHICLCHCPTFDK